MKQYMKDPIIIQPQRIKPIRYEAMKNLPVEFQRKSDGLSKKFCETLWVETKDIETISKLAFIVRKWYGFGTFNILFYNKLAMNKNYNPEFVCRVQRGLKCEYKGKCTNYDSQRWKRHKKGWSCKQNKKLNPTWSKRARIKIMPKEDYYGDDDFSYKWYPSHSKMWYFNRWFWKKYDRKVRGINKQM